MLENDDALQIVRADLANLVAAARKECATSAEVHMYAFVMIIISVPYGSMGNDIYLTFSFNDTLCATGNTQWIWICVMCIYILSIIYAHTHTTHTHTHTPMQELRQHLVGFEKLFTQFLAHRKIGNSVIWNRIQPLKPENVSPLFPQCSVCGNKSFQIGCVAVWLK